MTRIKQLVYRLTWRTPFQPCKTAFSMARSLFVILIILSTILCSFYFDKLDIINRIQCVKFHRLMTSMREREAWFWNIETQGSLEITALWWLFCRRRPFHAPRLIKIFIKNWFAINWVKNFQFRICLCFILVLISSHGQTLLVPTPSRQEKTMCHYFHLHKFCTIKIIFNQFESP